MPTVTADCPFCDGEYTLSDEAEIEGYEGKQCVALHTLPACAVFNAEEPDVFAAKAREALRKKEAN